MHLTRTALVWATALGLSTSCGSPIENVTTTTTTLSPWTTDSVPEPTFASSTGDPVPSSSEGSTTDDTESTTGHPTDTATPPDFGTDGLDCNGKIDILFAFDRGLEGEEFWSRMDTALTVVRPMMTEWFANFDTHWMVTTPHPIWGIVDCANECAANNFTSCVPVGPLDYPCGAYTDGSLGDCDTLIGAGSVFPAGFGASNTPCELEGGKRYIESSNTQNLLGELECITQTGWTDGNGAYAERGMVNAFSPLLNKFPDSCNLGFLREDALLLIVFTSRYVGTGINAAGPPEEWAAKIYEAKGGDQDKVAVVGIVTDQTSPEPTLCPKSGTLIYNSDVEHFLHHDIKHAVHGSQCADDYVPFFREGMELALELCGAEPPT